MRTNDSVSQISVNERDTRSLMNSIVFQRISQRNAPVITSDQLDISSVYEK